MFCNVNHVEVPEDDWAI